MFYKKAVTSIVIDSHKTLLSLVTLSQQPISDIL